MNYYMKFAYEESLKGIKKEHGGPFGAVIVKNNKIISSAHNEVLKRKDPICHAEVLAIQKACKKLKTQNLNDCILYTTCEPCPMCLSAIIWANISKVYYACNRKDAEKIGFKDDLIYEYFKGTNDDILSLNSLNRDECLETFLKYQGKLY